MNEKCRLCLKILRSELTGSITDEEFSGKLKSVFHFSIPADESLPELVCQCCVTTVANFHSFSQQVNANQKQLNIMLKEQKLAVFDDVKVETLIDDEASDHEKPSYSNSESITNVKREPLENIGTCNDEHDENEPFEVVKIETLNDDDLYDHEIEMSIQPDGNAKAKRKSTTQKKNTSNDGYDTDTLDNDEDLDDDEDFVPKIDPIEGKVRKHRRRTLKGEKITRKKERTLKVRHYAKLEDEDVDKQIEDDKRIQEFYKFECELCSVSLDNLVGLQGHYRREHAMKGYIRCCDKQLFRRFQLLDHIASHEGTIKCQICQKSYKSTRYLALHMMKSHSREEDRPFKCDKCHQSFHKEHLLKAHQANHLSEKCPICEKVVSSKYALKTHVAHMHGTDGTQICDVCGKEFRTKQAMERHINEHLGVEVVQKVQCHVCQRWFHGKYNLRKHIRFMHIEDGQIFKCDICQHESPNSRALVDHKKRVHVEERFECEFCGKRFKRKLYLREHIASHTGKPLYSCEVCGATFNSNANCYNHRKSKHPVEWEARKQAYLEAQRKSPNSDKKTNSL